ncbi:hypothetical protein [Desulfobacula sp.]|uniref:hypothetical protein n=1 Tax=Desulfobacula sp. TaxID=2593537 RepID=UPI00261C6BD8|nr:hypothetical protein [Desulfobacula sp.]
MSEIIKKTVFVFTVVIALGGSAWGGWFQFEPNIVLLNGTAVAQELKHIEKENDCITNGDVVGAKQLIIDKKVFIVKAENGGNGVPVEYVSYKEYKDSLFVRIKYQSGTKTWANMLGLACEGENGKERRVTKLDLDKGEFGPLSNVTR